MAAYRNVYNPRGTLRRQQYYALRHCLRKGRWLFKAKLGTDAAGRNADYYIREAMSLSRSLGQRGSLVLF